MLPNSISDRAEGIWLAIYATIFVLSGVFCIGFMIHFAPRGHDPVMASTLPPCRHNAVVVAHNQFPSCDLSDRGILIELGTTRSECADQGGRFVVHMNRPACYGEDI